MMSTLNYMISLVLTAINRSSEHFIIGNKSIPKYFTTCQISHTYIIFRPNQKKDKNVYVYINFYKIKPDQAPQSHRHTHYYLIRVACPVLIQSILIIFSLIDNKSLMGMSALWHYRTWCVYFQKLKGS